MDYSDGPRPLPWPLRNAVANSVITEDDGVQNPSFLIWPEDSNERVPVLFSLSLNEYVILASTIDVGSDIAYGADALKVVDLWLRNTREQVSSCALVLDALQNCEDVQQAIKFIIATAIQNDPAFMNSFSTWLTIDPNAQGAIEEVASHQVIAQVARQQNLFMSGQCGYGYIFNEVSVAIETLHTISQTILTNVSGSAGVSLQVATLTSLIPITGLSLQTFVLMGVAAALAGSVKTSYDGAWSDPTTYDELRCDLFCEVRDSCQLSLDQIINYYMHRTGLDDNLGPFDQFLLVCESLMGSPTGERAVWMMHLLVLQAIRLSQEVAGIDFGGYAVAVTLAGEIEDNSYLTVCDVCPVYLDLEAVIGYPTMLRFVGIEDGDYIYDWESIYTGNYATGSLRSVGDIPFHVRSIEVVEGEFNLGASLGFAGGSYDLETFPYETLTDIGMGMYNLDAGSVLRIRVYG